MSHVADDDEPGEAGAAGAASTDLEDPPMTGGDGGRTATGSD